MMTLHSRSSLTDPRKRHWPRGFEVGEMRRRRRRGKVSARAFAFKDGLGLRDDTYR